MSDRTVFDPVAGDLNVLAAIAELDLAILACVEKHGLDLVTVIVAWVVENDADTLTAGSMLAGDLSAEMIEFATATIADDACALPIHSDGSVMN